ncbi:hypothetical protein FB451DRAFT_1211984 [Mycena latifolia]|nr:hypothetical protein FB451DRAFT_1211984 [Mycena latifolia]
MAPRKKAANSSRSRKKLILKGNGPFLDLPFDILLEILKILHPLDLLYLSRTNKTLRGFLLDRSNASIWRTSFESVEGSPPPCPAYTCEPQWARLLFEEVCHVCLSTLEHDFLSDPIWWEFGARYCSECYSDQIVDKLPKKLTSGPEWSTSRPGRGYYIAKRSAVFPCINGSYLAKDVDEFMVKYSALNTENDKKALIRERRDQTKVLSDHARICRAWMKDIVKVHTVAQRATKEARLNAISDKLHEAGWGSVLLAHHYMYSLKDHDLVTIPRPLNDAEWAKIGPKLIADVEAGLKGSVMSQRFSSLYQTFANSLDGLTKNLAFPPTILDVALIPEVRAILEVDVKVKLGVEDFTAALTPQLPTLVSAWSRAFEQELRDHTRAALNLPPDSAADPFEHALAYFTCPRKCCQGHFTGRWNPCPPWSYWSDSTPETYAEGAARAYHRDPCTVDRLSLEKGRAILENVIKLYGKDPQSATCEEMDAAPGKLWCMRCSMANQPAGWRDAPAHSTKFHEKWSSLRARFEVEIETETESE